jgi:hypothetical protein
VRHLAENTYELQKQGTSKSGKYGTLLVSILVIKKQSEVIQEPGQSTENMECTESSKNQRAAHASDEAKLPLEDQVVALFDQADCSADKLSNAKRMSVVENTADTVNDGIEVGDSDGFALVCGYVEQLVEIGDVVSKASTKSSY